MGSLLPTYETQVTPEFYPARPLRQDTQLVSPVGGAVSALMGNTANRLIGIDYTNQRIAQVQQDQQATAQAEVAASQAHVDMAQHMQDLQDATPDDPSGFTGKVVSDFADYRDKLLAQTPNPAANRVLSVHMANLGANLADSAMRWEAQQNIAYRGQQVQQIGNNYSTVVGQDPTQYSPILDAAQGAVDTMNLPPEVRAKYKQALDTQLTGSAFQGFATLHPRLAQGAINQRLGIPAPEIPDSVAPFDPNAPTMPSPSSGAPVAAGVRGDVIAAANAQGVAPSTLLTIGQLESGLNPSAKNPSSSAAGTFQFTKGTWSQYGAGGDVMNSAANASAAAKLTAANVAGLTQTLGRAPTDTETYAAHLFGLPGAQAILGADGKQPLLSVVQGYDPKDAQSIVANNGFGGMTVDQAKAALDARVANAQRSVAATTAQSPSQLASSFADSVVDPAVPTPAPLTTKIDVNQKVGVPFIDHMNEQQLLAAKNYADSLVGKDTSDAQSQYRAWWHNAGAQAQNGIVPDPPDSDLLTRAVGPARAPEELAKYDTLRRYATGISQANAMDAPTMQSTYQSLQPSGPNDPEYANKLRLATQFQHAATAVLNARAKDPIAAARDQGIASVGQLNFSDPNALNAELQNRQSVALNMAQRFGVNQYSALTNDEAKSYAQNWAQMDSASQVSALGAMHRSLTDPRVFGATVQAIRPDSPATLMAASLADRPDSQQSPDGVPARQVAFGILEGERLLRPPAQAAATEGKGRQFTLPPTGGAAGMDQQFASDVGSAFVDNPTQFNSAKAAVYDYYAHLAAGAGKYDGVLIPKLLSTAETSVLGEMGKWSQGLFSSSQKVLMPWGMDQDAWSHQIAGAYARSMAGAGLTGSSVDEAHNTQLVPLDEYHYGLRSGSTTIKGRNGQPVVLDISPVNGPS